MDICPEVLFWKASNHFALIIRKIEKTATIHDLYLQIFQAFLLPLSSVLQFHQSDKKKKNCSIPMQKQTLGIWKQIFFQGTDLMNLIDFYQ